MRDRSNNLEQANSFGKAADVYASARPSYPAEVVDWLVPAGAVDVLDVGAGTGKLTELLADGRRRVVAVDPSAEMLAQLSSRMPGVETHVASAESLPLADDSVDAVTVAQAWHWINPEKASPELARVLRPGGTLGLVWNTRDASVGWVAHLDEIMGADPHYGPEGHPVVCAPFLPLETWRTRWSQSLTRDGLLDLVRSRSFFITASPERQAETLERVRELLDTHPQLAGREAIELPYITECFRTRTA